MTTTDNTAVIRQLEQRVESLQDKLDAETKARKDAQIIGLDIARQFDRYGLVISAALQGKRHPSEPDNDGRMNAVRVMVEENKGLRCHVERLRDDRIAGDLEHAGQGGEPEGYALVPKTIRLSYDQLEYIATMAGWGNGEDECSDVVLWVGTIKNDDGSKSYGLNISCIECVEEGACQIHELMPPQTKKFFPYDGINVTKKWLKQVHDVLDVFHKLLRFYKCSDRTYFAHTEARLSEIKAMLDEPRGETDNE